MKKIKHTPEIFTGKIGRIEGYSAAKKPKAVVAAKPKTAAIVTIHDAPSMTPSGRRRIAKWLRSRADLLEKHGDLMSKRFVSHWLFDEVE